jgi:hypothetical protein
LNQSTASRTRRSEAAVHLSSRLQAAHVFREPRVDSIRDARRGSRRKQRFIVRPRNPCDCFQRLLSCRRDFWRVRPVIILVPFSRQKAHRFHLVNHADQPACVHPKLSRQIALTEPGCMDRPAKDPCMAVSELQRRQLLTKPPGGMRTSFAQSPILECNLVHSRGAICEYRLEDRRRRQVADKDRERSHFHTISNAPALCVSATRDKRG